MELSTYLGQASDPTELPYAGRIHLVERVDFGLDLDLILQYLVEVLNNSMKHLVVVRHDLECLQVGLHLSGYDCSIDIALRAECGVAVHSSMWGTKKDKPSDGVDESRKVGSVGVGDVKSLYGIHVKRLSLMGMVEIHLHAEVSSRQNNERRI